MSLTLLPTPKVSAALYPHEMKIRVSPETKDELLILASMDGVDLSDVVRAALDEFLAERERLKRDSQAKIIGFPPQDPRGCEGRHGRFGFDG